jgi:pilus assembly protein CpaE
MQFFVASNNATVNAWLQEALDGQGHDCVISALTPASQVANRLTQANADVLIVVLSPDPAPALALLHGSRSPSVKRVLAIGPVGEPKLRLAALQEGADYLDEAQLALEFEAILRRLSSRQAPTKNENGRVISVLAPSGGGGSSTLAVNLATALAKAHKSCLLLDLNLGAGDLASLLDLKPTHTLADLCRNSTRMDQAIFERSLVRHASGVSLLSPSRSFADIGQVTAQGVNDVLTLARSLFPYVICDLDDSFHSEQTQTLRQSDVILLVLRLDFTSLRNTQRTLDHLAQLQIHRDRVRIVVNRYGQPKELPTSKAEEVLKMKIAHYVPDDPKTINRANNNGVPAILDAPTAKVSKSILQLAVSINGCPKAPQSPET